MISFRSSAQFDQPAALVLLTKEQLQKNAVKDLRWSSLADEVKGLVKSKQFSAKSGELFPLSADDQIVLLLGLGKEADLDSTALRVELRKALLSPFVKKASSLEIIPLQNHQDDLSVIAIIEAVVIGTYAWEKYKTPDGDEENRKKSYKIVAPAKKIYHDAITICEGVNFARDLVNDNADVVTAAFLEKAMASLAKGQKNITLEVLGRKELKEKGLNLLLAVNQGSRNEPRLAIARYQGSRKTGYDIAVVGKGITFDTGGLNLKTSGHIETMRQDMGGAAAVLGALKNCIALKPKKNILFACGLAENAVGSGACKPGDVVKSYSGKTVEIANTDAEGRLVLADALAYVNKRYSPKVIVDVATLTGSCITALGHDYTGLISNNEKFIEKIKAAAAKTDDRVWQLPLYKELKGCMKSQIADIRNISNGKGAGTITAGYFLKQFIGDTPWVHLDIAGTAFVGKCPRLYFGHGATGAGVRLITEFLRG